MRRYERDLAGQVTKTHLPSRRTTDIAWDKAGRVVKVKHSDGTGAEFEYREDGALLRAKNESAEVFFERDAVGRVVKESVGDEWVSSEYAVDGQRCALETSLGARLAVEHDALGDVDKLRIGPDPFWESVIRFERDAEGLEIGRALPGGVHVSWTRDQAGRPLERRTKATKGDEWWHLDVRRYDWRGEDHIASIAELTRGRTEYEHDARGRLIAQHGPGCVLHRAMDAVGNIFRTPERTDRRYGRGGRLESADRCRSSGPVGPVSVGASPRVAVAPAYGLPTRVGLECFAAAALGVPRRSCQTGVLFVLACATSLRQNSERSSPAHRCSSRRRRTSVMPSSGVTRRCSWMACSPASLGSMTRCRSP